MSITERTIVDRSQFADTPQDSDILHVPDREYNVGDELLNEEQILGSVQQLAAKAKERYGDEEVVVVYLADGAMPFAKDFIDAFEGLEGNLVNFVGMKTSFYDEKNQPLEKPEMSLDTKFDFDGRHILILDDLIDKGKTLKAVYEYITNQYPEEVQKKLDLESKPKPKSTRTMTLLDKPDAREVDFEVDDKAVIIPNVWVKGYGMDSRGRRSARRSITADDHYKPNPQFKLSRPNGR